MTVSVGFCGIISLGVLWAFWTVKLFIGGITSFVAGLFFLLQNYYIAVFIRFLKNQEPFKVIILKIDSEILHTLSIGINYTQSSLQVKFPGLLVCIKVVF